MDADTTALRRDLAIERLRPLLQVRPGMADVAATILRHAPCAADPGDDAALKAAAAQIAKSNAAAFELAPPSRAEQRADAEARHVELRKLGIL